MTTTAASRMTGSIYDGFSPRGQSALAELRAEFQAAGFYAEKERRTERTLRVYPERRWRYPLLNPWIERAGRNAIANVPKPSVFCPIYSDGDALITRLLESLPAAKGYSYVPGRPRKPGRYFLHGSLILPIAFDGEPGAQRIDFTPLRTALAKLQVELSSAGWSLDHW